MKSQNGWALLPRAILTAMTWKLPQVTGRVRKKSVWVILHWIAWQFDLHVEPIHKAGSWGYSYRRISGSRKWSNHASGTAIDLNASRHPAGRTGTFTTEQIRVIHTLINRCGGVVRWGHGFADEMHFEIAPGTTKRQVQELATWLLQKQLLELGYDLGPAGADRQRGPKTKAALRHFQADHNLPTTGVDTPAVWAAIRTAITLTHKETTAS